MTLNFRTFVAALVLLTMIGLCVHRAHAADATVSWTHPTEYTDNTPILLGALTQTSIQYGKCNAGQNGLLASPAPVTVVVPYPATSRVITGLGDGTWCFAARSETANAQSAFTPYVFKAIILTPKPPVMNSTITVAYETWKFFGKTYLGRSVGSIPLGVPCSAQIVKTGNTTYYEIPSSAVKFNRTPRPGPIVTRCAAA